MLGLKIIFQEVLYASMLELIQDKEAERRAANDDYLFGLGNGAFAVNAAKFGNVGRFINHSCSPKP